MLYSVCKSINHDICFCFVKNISIPNLKLKHLFTVEMEIFDALKELNMVMTLYRMNVENCNSLLSPDNAVDVKSFNATAVAAIAFLS